MSLINFTRKVGPTINGKKPLIGIPATERRKILNNIAKDWRYIIRRHFKNEATVATTDRLLSQWQPLDPVYKRRKIREGFYPGILEASGPKLYQRYSRSIRINSKTFSLEINYPQLISGGIGRTGPAADAGVHQLGKVKRPLILQGFKDAARKNIIKYFTNE